MGSYFWAETGSVYTGVWKSNERGGRGLFVFGPRRPGGGGVVYGGEWSKGRMHGKGRIIFIDEHNRVQTLNEVDMKKLVRDGRNDIVRFWVLFFFLPEIGNSIAFCILHAQQS